MNEPVSKCLLVLAALQVRALLVLACVILIPYERTRIEVLAAACLCGTDTLRTNPYQSACWCLLAGACLLVLGCWCLVAGAWLLVLGCLLLVLGCLLLVLGCLLLVLAALQVRALLVLGCLLLVLACWCLLV